MKINIYKLGEYKIIESDAGELRWEAHFGLGELQEGRCFKNDVRQGDLTGKNMTESRGIVSGCMRDSMV
jgi:hypothetical protein